MDQSIQDILKTIDDSISKFQDAIPGIQKLMYDELQPIVKQLQIKDGKLLNNLDNLKLLGSLQNKLEKVIISAQYKQSVNGFIDSFTDISNLNMDYFKQFNQKYSPAKTLPIIQSLAIEQTVNDLMGQGLVSNVINPIKSILTQNITTGGNYAQFQDQLQNYLLNNNTGEGSLVKYTKQITTDAINQYNAQYAETIAQDLQFSWGRYVGSNINTSREFCIYLTRKQWVHKTELPTIIEGDIDGHQCKLSKSTGLPIGMIPDTNASNFKIRRGGYNCGHQFFWIPDSAVPAVIKAAIGNNNSEDKKIPLTAAVIAGADSGNNTPSGTPISNQLTNIQAEIKSVVNNAINAIDSVHGDGVLKNIPIDLYNLHDGANGEFYADKGIPIHIQIKKSGNTPELTFAHEMGHYLDYQAIGKQGVFDSALSNGVTKELINAISKTDTILGIKKALNDGYLTNNGKEIILSKTLINHLKYLLDPREMFARAYAQFISVKSGNASLMNQLQLRQDLDSALSIGYQWPDSEFKPIEAAMEKLFIQQGWINQ